MVKRVVISDQPGSPGSTGSHVPYVSLENSHSNMKVKNMTPVAITNQLVTTINNKVRTGSGVRGRSATATSEHVLNVAVDYYRGSGARRRIWWIACLTPAYLIVVSLLRLNLIGTIYVVCFMVCATTHPLLTGVDPNSQHSRSCIGIYISGVAATISLVFQLTMQAAYHFWVKGDQGGLLDSTWAEMVGVCHLSDVSVGRRVRCIVPELLLVMIAVTLRVMCGKVNSLGHSSLLGGAGEGPSPSVSQSRGVVRFSLAAISSGMTAVSHPSLVDIPFLIVFLVYCVTWSIPNNEHHQHRLFSLFFSVSSASSSYSKLATIHLNLSRLLLAFCVVVMLLHYITFIPYVAHHIPDTNIYKAIGLNWLDEEHGIEGNIDLGVGNVLHVGFLSGLFLLLCAYDRGKAEALKKPEREFDESSDDSENDFLADTQRKSEIASVGTHSIGGFRYSRSHASFIARRLGAESRRKLAFSRIIAICRTNSQRYCSRIVVVLIAVVIVLQPSVMSSLWLVVFLFSLLRRYTFFQFLTPTLILAVIHVVSVWVLSVPGVITDSKLRKSLAIAGLAAGDCGGIGTGEHDCQLLLLPVLGLLLVFICMTSRLYKKRKLQHELGDNTLNDAQTIFDPSSIVDRTRRLFHKAFIAVSIFVIYFVSCWTVDGTHFLLFIVSLALFYKPSLAHKSVCSGILLWSLLLLYISAMLCFLYLFRLLEEDFVPALESVHASTQDVVGLHDRNTLQLAPLFILLFFAIKQRDILKVKCFQRKHSFRAAAPSDSGVEMNTMQDVDTATAAMVKQKTLSSEIQLKFRLLTKLSFMLGIPPHIVLDLVSLTTLLCVAGFGSVSIINGILYFFFLLLAFLSINYPPDHERGTYKIKVWKVCRIYTTISLLVLYLYQWSWCRSQIKAALEATDWLHVSGLTVFGSEDRHGGSIDVFVGLLPLQVVLVLIHLQILFNTSIKTQNLINRTMSISQLNKQATTVDSLTGLIRAYANPFTTVALFLGAVLSTSSYRASLISTPYALFLSVYMFAPAFGIKGARILHRLIQGYSFLFCVAFLFYQLPFVQKSLIEAVGEATVEYVGLKIAQSHFLSVLWTHTLVYVVAVLSSRSLKWGVSEGQVHSGYTLFSETSPTRPSVEPAFTKRYIKYILWWFWVTLKAGVLDFGSRPERFASLYAYSLSLFSLLLLMSLVPSTVVAFVCLLLVTACHRIGKAGMGLPLPFCSAVSRWFVVFIITWLLLCAQYLVFLGLPPNYDEIEVFWSTNGNETILDDRHVPYNFTDLGEYREYLNTDVTPLVLASQAFVVMCVVAQWGVLKRDKAAGVNPYLRYQQSLLTTSSILYERRKEFRDARRAIWAIYGSGVLAERVPFPLGDLHSIAASSGLPVTGCGCSACTHAPSRLVTPENDFTSSSDGARTPLDHLRYIVCISLPYLTVTIIFIDGAQSSSIGVIDCSKVFLSLAFFHLCENLKWRGSHLWRWILRIYSLFLLTSCVLFFPEIKTRIEEDTLSELHRHFVVTHYGTHIAVMVLAYLMEVLYDRQDWAFILYRDQQLQIQSRDTGEMIQQEWLVRLDEQKRLLAQAKEKRKLKLQSVRAGCSSTDITICPRCARMANDDICEECSISLRRANLSHSFASTSCFDSLSPPHTHSIGPLPIDSSQGLSLLEEKLISEGYIGHSKFSTLAVAKTQPELDETSSCTSSTMLSVEWGEEKDSSVNNAVIEPLLRRRKSVFKNSERRGSSDLVPPNQSISTITMGGRYQGRASKKATSANDLPERVIVLRSDGGAPAAKPSVHEDEFSSSLPYLHLVNRFLDVIIAYLNDHSIPYPSKQLSRYKAMCRSLGWFAASHTDMVCYILFISNFLVNPCLMNLPPVLSVLVYAMVLYPRPHVWYWRASLYYLYMLITVKSVFLSMLKGAFDDLQVRLPFLFGQVDSFFSGVLIELLSILSIIGHRYMLKSLGLWSDISLHCNYQLTRHDEFSGKSTSSKNSPFAPREVTITHLTCEEILEGKLVVSPSSQVTYSVGVGSGLLLKQTDGNEPRIVTHLTYISEENILRDQDGCGGKIPAQELGEALSLIGDMAERAQVDHDLPVIGGSSVSVAEAGIFDGDDELWWVPRSATLLYLNVFVNQMKTGGDLYLSMITIELVSFVMFIFSFYSIVENSPDDDIASSISNNMLPGSLVLAQLGLLLLIVVDRVLYLHKALFMKFSLQILLTTLYFGLFCKWSSDRLATEVETKHSIVSSTSTSQSRIVAILMITKIIYLMISAEQIKEGYTELSRLFAFQDRHHPIFYKLYTVTRTIPFVHELRVVLDWTFTATTLKFKWWVKMQDIIHELYVARCDREDTRLLNRKAGKTKKYPPSRRFLQGCTLLTILIAIIFFPLMYYSSFSPALTSNHVEHIKLSISIVGAPPFYTGREALPATNRRDLTNSIMKKIQLTRPTLLGFDYRGRQLQLVELPRYSQTVWWITREGRMNAISDLWNFTQALSVLQVYSGGRDNITLDEARLMASNSPLGARICPLSPVLGCESNIDFVMLRCCSGLELWKSLAGENQTHLDINDEKAVTEAYVKGVFHLPHPVDIQIDIEVTRSAASDASLLSLATAMTYTLPPASRVAIATALRDEVRKEMVLDHFYSPFLFNRRQLLKLYVPEGYAQLKCTFVLEPGIDHNCTNGTKCAPTRGFSSFSTSFVCDSLFQNGNPLDAGFVFSEPELTCFSQSKYFRYSGCPAYDSKEHPRDFGKRSMYIVTASDNVTDNSGWGALLASFSIAALYTTFVLAIGRVIRGMFVGSAHRVVLEDMLDPRPVEYIVKCMHYARCEGDLVLESALYQELLRLYRSPESLREFTATDVV
eukprot:TRINITY_DN2413_c0_g4_i1.p1 TRINITY_DN2413_c0_g4~~TRINITY_DN2413_c0_g4_i1.p1  ORF type:complete len:2832 (+),score=358.96 TRINITY_DN2413_c0_g4_i1:61-8556(+)